MSDFAVYCFYVNRIALLQRALKSFATEELTIVDNSDGKTCFSSSYYPCVFTPPVPLTYAQSMNWMLKDAIQRKIDFIIHFHSDAYSTNENAMNELLEKIREYKTTGRKWACAWTHYDILWAINPVALADIGGWDTNLPTYFGDNDARRRWELTGWECINTHIKGVDHEGSATINSDPMLKFMNAQVFPLHSYYYQQKWGGEPGHEVYEVPFGRTDLFGVK